MDKEGREERLQYILLASGKFEDTSDLQPCFRYLWTEEEPL